MSFFQKLFKRKDTGAKSRLGQMLNAQPDREPDWDDIIFERAHLKIHDKEQRKQYITGCLQQMRDAEKELEQLHYEYSVITSRLTDIEELERLPDYILNEIKETAKHITQIDTDTESYQRKKHMTDEQFKNMEALEDQIPDGISKLNETEEYHKKVKSDLRRLNGEKMAYQYRLTELWEEVENYKGLAIVCFATMAGCLALLFILQMLLEFDTRLGYVLIVCVMALLIIRLFLKHSDAQKEIESAEKDLNRIITLLNRVKIRYVNNKNLQHYLQMKYRTQTAKELQKRWEEYLEEKEEREQLQRAQQDYTFYQKDLLRLLRTSRIKDTSVWLHQTAAIVDPKEMVELRHGLIGNRQALREQMEHNQKLAKTAKEEITEISKQYPEYAQEILDMIGIYEKAGTV